MAKKPTTRKRTTPAPTSELTPDEMKAALLQAQHERVNAASQEIKAVCDKYKVKLIPRMITSPGHVEGTISIEPNE